MPRSGRKVSPARRYQEDLDAARRDREHWEREKREEASQLAQAVRHNDRQAERRIRSSMAASDRAIARCKEREDDARRKLANARDAQGRRPGGWFG